ncbi:MAG: glycoside hydrolase family 3 protein [Chloroflexi bacterium]|nr:glycoside hydrolase family 3 protein [Chloroflexota bacterium]
MRGKRRRFWWLSLVLLAGLVSWGGLGPVVPAAGDMADDHMRRGIQLDDLTLEEKVGQLFLITIYSANLDDADRDLIADVLPGGVVLFPMNIVDAEQVTALTNALQTEAQAVGVGVPLLIAVDQEGGPVRRLKDGFSPFPSVQLVGGAGSRDDAWQVGVALGQELAAVGVNMNLAPVADLHRVESGGVPGQVLYRRTISSDPDLVGELAGGMVDGMGEAGVIGVLKHFPGHGAATQDSHNELPHVDLALEDVQRTSLRAFEGAFSSSARAVMTGHLWYPALDPAVTRPATMSPMVLGLLREGMGFDGVVITDAMDMGAILREYTLSGAVIAAINAGVDLVTFGPHVSAQDQRVVINSTIQAVRSGAIPMERLDEAVTRVLALRVAYGLTAWSALDVNETEQRLLLDAHHQALVAVAENAVTVLDNAQDLLPLDSENQRVAVIYPSTYSHILNACWGIDPDLMWYGYTYQPTSQDFAAVETLAQNAETVVIFVEDLHQNTTQLRLAESLPPERTVTVLLRSPFDWERLPEPLTTVVLTYDSIPATHVAACRVLYGVVPARGRLPMAVGPYPPGMGVQLPEEVGDW